MNVFVLDVDPVTAAQQQCNKHVVKMVLESAQLLITALPPDTTRYKHTHFNHPCSKWVRSSLSNYKWLAVHAFALCEEYTRRYNRVHVTQEIIEQCVNTTPDLSDVGLTLFARAIKEPWKTQTADLDIVEAYRRYYIGDKARFARWAPRASAPAWWPFEEKT